MCKRSTQREWARFERGQNLVFDYHTNTVKGIDDKAVSAEADNATTCEAKVQSITALDIELPCTSRGTWTAHHHWICGKKKGLSGVHACVLCEKLRRSFLTWWLNLQPQCEQQVPGSDLLLFIFPLASTEYRIKSSLGNLFFSHTFAMAGATARHLQQDYAPTTSCYALSARCVSHSSTTSPVP